MIESRATRPRLPIATLGVPFDNVTMSDALWIIQEMLESGRSHYIVTANVDFLVQARRDVELRRILVDAPLVLCDGTHLVWLSRFFGNSLPERVAGSDLTPRLMRLAEVTGKSIYLLGGAPEVLEQAVANLRARHPQLKIAGYWSPPFDPLLKMDHGETTRRIRDARPDILFVAFGCPKAEKWMAMHYRTLGVPVMIGVGCSIDFLAGHRRRAPVWMRKAGLEWLHRMLQEPKRLGRRYSADLWHFGRAILKQWALLQCQPRWFASHRREMHVRWSRAGNRVTMAGCFDAAAVQRHRDDWEALSAGRTHCLLDLRDVGALDSTAAAMLLRLRRQFRERGTQLVLVEPSHAVRRALEFMRVWDLFYRVSDEALAYRLLEQLAAQQTIYVVPGQRRPLVWQGEVTAANAELVWGLTQTHLDQSAQQPVVVDLCRVRFLDTSGVDVMLRAHQLATERGSAVRFRSASPAVRNVLRRTPLEADLLTEFS